MRDTFSKTFPILGEDDIRRSATAIGDTNPIHHDEAAAITNGFLGIVLPGVSILGLVSSTIAEESPGAALHGFQVKFKGPLYAGSRPCVECRITASKAQVIALAVAVKNGFEIIATGTCTVLMPENKASQEEMAA